MAEYDYDESEGFEELTDVISLDEFDYRHYARHEQTILKPRLERKGFTNVEFSMGEYDSFGPLTRVVKATDGDGKARKFVYG